MVIADYISIIDNFFRYYNMPHSKKSKPFQKRKSVKSVKSVKNVKTLKRPIGKRVWMYKKGNIVFCYRVPYLRILPMSMDEMVHGGGVSEPELSNKLFEQLKSISKEVSPFLESYQNKKGELVKLLIKTFPPDGKKTLESLSDPSKSIIEKNKLTEDGEALLEWVKGRQNAQKITEDILKQLEGNNYTDKEKESIKKILNHDMSNSTGILSSMTTNAFNTLSKGTNSLSSFLTVSPTDDVPKKRNDTRVQLLWYPRSSIHYRKGTSIAVDKSDPKYGEFMVYIEPEKYADSVTYLSDRFTSVEDFLANVLNGCTDAMCTKGEPVRPPFKHQVLEINNYQPEFDMKPQI